ncbi:MAG TPA: hypothetical protein PLY87_29475 [Planctomycetaceae bacterium]|nr:hypothetical protein [Planctomycetaceae bacterium]HQZ69268.1 hypothetical protein [Planctomycetaceae bacterium]
MNIAIFSGIFAVIAIIAFLMILGASGFVFYNVLSTSNRAARNAGQTAGHGSGAPDSDRKRRALDIIGKKPAHQPAHKCQACGATIDSTAELSADGKVRCNYCNAWSSIY